MVGSGWQLVGSWRGRPARPGGSWALRPRRESGPSWSVSHPPPQPTAPPPQTPPRHPSLHPPQRPRRPLRPQPPPCSGWPACAAPGPPHREASRRRLRRPLAQPQQLWCASGVPASQQRAAQWPLRHWQGPRLRGCGSAPRPAAQQAKLPAQPHAPQGDYASPPAAIRPASFACEEGPPPPAALMWTARRSPSRPPGRAPWPQLAAEPLRDSQPQGRLRPHARARPGRSHRWARTRLPAQEARLPCEAPPHCRRR